MEIKISIPVSKDFTDDELGDRMAEVLAPLDVGMTDLLKKGYSFSIVVHQEVK
jgi:hypothetical protein